MKIIDLPTHATVTIARPEAANARRPQKAPLPSQRAPIASS